MRDVPFVSSLVDGVPSFRVTARTRNLGAQSIVRRPRDEGMCLKVKHAGCGGEMMKGMCHGFCALVSDTICINVPRDEHI